MPKSRGRRVRRSEEEWQEILQRFESSRLSAREFCRREGLPLSSFQRWQPRLKTRSVGEFVDLASSSSAPAAPWELEVSLPNGVRLQFRG